jgi:hypothetical protein
MNEETMLEVWQREKKEGVSLKVSFQRSVYDYRWLILVWLLVLPTYPFMVSHLGLIMKIWLVLFIVASAGVVLEIRSQHHYCDQMMSIVAEMHSEDDKHD